MITVTYLYSACFVIRSPEVGVLTDPWFSEGAYDGSWYHYPPFEDALERVPACDLVYVSHLHPDHYDPAFLLAYLDRHPTARVVIAEFARDYLSRRMSADGIPHEAHARLERGATRLGLFPNERSDYEIDSALTVVRETESVVDMNDNLLFAPQIEAIRGFVGQRPTIALLGYTGAGAWPQTYYENEDQLIRRAEEKKQDFFERYRAMQRALDPIVSIPCAGQYILGGRHHSLNRYRGVADALEVLAFDPAAVVLADGGRASIDTLRLVPTAVRTERYDPVAIDAHAATLADRPMDYERVLGDVPMEAIPFRRLLTAAHKNAQERSPCSQTYYFCIRLPQGWFVADARRGGEPGRIADDVVDLEPRAEISIDPRYLFGLLTGLFHWNNADVGSQYRVRRVPDDFVRDAQAFLSFLHV